VTGPARRRSGSTGRRRAAGSLRVSDPTWRP